MRRWWEDNIKMDFKDVAWVGDTWAGLVWFRTGICGRFCECGDELSGSIKYVELSLCPEIFVTTVRFFMSVKIERCCALITLINRLFDDVVSTVEISAFSCRNNNNNNHYKRQLYLEHHT